MKHTMLTPIPSKFLVPLALFLLVLHTVPFMVIASVSDKQVNWFYLVLLGLLSLALVFLLIGSVYVLQQQRTRLQNSINHFVHELKSPLTAVTIGLEALRDETTRRNADLSEEFLSISLLELERLTLMVENTLRLFNYDQNGAAIQLQPVNLEKVVKQALKAVQLQAQHRHADIRVEIIAPDLKVLVDRMHLTSALVNLLDNALKYSPHEPRIVIRLYQAAQQAVLVVQDSGMGIAPEHQSHVFDKHYRVPAKAVSKIKGHGLGLHYVAWVVRKHGGTIGVQSEAGAGSQFEVRLPFAIQK
jgi:two-component system phosphate regulon sensor histidine kinase PhoR